MLISLLVVKFLFVGRRFKSPDKVFEELENVIELLGNTKIKQLFDTDMLWQDEWAGTGGPEAAETGVAVWCGNV